MSGDEPLDVLDLLADDHAQTILEHTMTEPRSADELSEICDASPQTIYRRLDALAEHDLVEATVTPEDSGHHYREYRATLDRVVVSLVEDGLEVRTTRRNRMADRFTQFVTEVGDR